MADEEKKVSYSGPKVLLCDDDAEMLVFLATILRKRGFRNIEMIPTGKEALELLEKEKFDIVLLDCMMPEMDGYEVCKAIRSKDKTKFLPIIFLSALEESEDKVKGFKVGANDFVTKPVNEDELMARVTTHLEIANSRVLAVKLEKYKILYTTSNLLAHEVFNPLSILSGNLQYIQMVIESANIKVKDGELLDQKINSAIDSCDRIIITIEKIRKLSTEKVEEVDVIKGKLGID